MQFFPVIETLSVDDSVLLTKQDEANFLTVSATKGGVCVHQMILSKLRAIPRSWYMSGRCSRCS